MHAPTATEIRELFDSCSQAHCTQGTYSRQLFWTYWLDLSTSWKPECSQSDAELSYRRRSRKSAIHNLHQVNACFALRFTICNVEQQHRFTQTSRCNDIEVDAGQGQEQGQSLEQQLPRECLHSLEVCLPQKSVTGFRH